MKSLLSFFLAFSIFTITLSSSFAAGTEGNHINPNSPTVTKESMKKLNWKTRLALKLVGKKIAKKMDAKDSNKANEFDAVGFLLGLLLGLIGVIVAYILKGSGTLSDDAPKSAWLGLLAAIVIVILLVVLVFSAASSTV